RRFRQADLRRGQEVEQGDAGGQYQAGMNSRRAAALRNFDPAYVGSGSWLCENSSAGRVRRISRRNCVSRESNLAAYISLDAAWENSTLHTSLIYEFSHSQGQSRPFGDVCSMSGLPPESGPTSRSRNYFRRQLLVNAAIAASCVGSQPCVDVRSS